MTALDPRPEKGQTELFGDEEDRFHRLNRVMDDVNNRYWGVHPHPRRADAPLRHAQRPSPRPGNPTGTGRPSSRRQKKRRSANRLNKALPLVAGAVHPAADGDRLHLPCTWPEQVLTALLQPGVIVFRRDNDRHPVVDVGQFLPGRCRDDDATLHRPVRSPARPTRAPQRKTAPPPPCE